jgi:hypothetical protein
MVPLIEQCRHGGPRNITVGPRRQWPLPLPTRLLLVSSGLLSLPRRHHPLTPQKSQTRPRLDHSVRLYTRRKDCATTIIDHLPKGQASCLLSHIWARLFERLPCRRASGAPGSLDSTWTSGPFGPTCPLVCPLYVPLGKRGEVEGVRFKPNRHQNDRLAPPTTASTCHLHLHSWAPGSHLTPTTIQTFTYDKPRNIPPTPTLHTSPPHPTPHSSLHPLPSTRTPRRTSTSSPAPHTTPSTTQPPVDCPSRPSVWSFATASTNPCTSAPAKSAQTGTASSSHCPPNPSSFRPPPTQPPSSTTSLFHPLAACPPPRSRQSGGLDHSAALVGVHRSAPRAAMANSNQRTARSSWAGAATLKSSASRADVRWASPVQSAGCQGE